MIKTAKIIILLIIFAISIKCTEKEVIDREYPIIENLPLTEISEKYYLNAKFIQRGDFQITEYGFIWTDANDYPSAHNNNVIKFTGNIQEDKFSARVPNFLLSNPNYVVRPFVVTEDYTVYGVGTPYIRLYP